ncbi:MAG: cytochrome c oxidase subunit II [Methylobacillus sp.]|jgi:cytochrome c oxidase subunit 2|nr:cytochrome c oxidase subunit II [Methylobacillus sp.]
MVFRFLQKVGMGLMLVLWSFAARAEYAWNFPTPATPMAADTLHVHNKFMVITMIIFVVVLGIMIYSIYAHRKSKGHQPASFTGPGTKAQVFWTLVPFAILLYIDFILMGIPAYHSVLLMQDTKNGAEMVVKVTGSQWRWQYEYMDGDAKGIQFVSTLTTTPDQIANQAAKNEHYLLEVDNPLVLPVNKKVRILLTANDVIHTWWVPAFGSARDAIPGFLRETWVQIEKPGTYRGQCKELCGKGHGFMPVVVEAKPEAEYNIWVAEQKAKMSAASADAGKEWSQEELMTQGKAVYEKNCAACHQPDGKGIPPTFPALAGSKIINGPNFDASGKLLADSHVDRVFNGKNAMPAWKTMLSDADIAAVVTYERNSFGNTMGDLVQPSQIKALR